MDDYEIIEYFNDPHFVTIRYGSSNPQHIDTRDYEYRIIMNFIKNILRYDYAGQWTVHDDKTLEPIGTLCLWRPGAATPGKWAENLGPLYNRV